MLLKTSVIERSFRILILVNDTVVNTSHQNLLLTALVAVGDAGTTMTFVGTVTDTRNYGDVIRFLVVCTEPVFLRKRRRMKHVTEF